MAQNPLSILSKEPLDHQLEHFLGGEAKYYIIPVPTPLSKTAAALFLAQSIPLAESADKMRKLARLAAFYNVTEAAPMFIKVFGGLGRSDASARWAAAISGAAWVGGPDDRSRIRESLPELLARADVFEDRAAIYDMFDAIGPEPADPKSAATRLGQWLDAGITRFDLKIEDTRRLKGAEEAELVHAQKVTVEEYRTTNVPRLEGIGAQRVKLLALPSDEAKIKAMVPLAIAETPESGKEIQYWSSIMLLRLGGTTDPVSFDPAAVSKGPPAETDEAKARRVNRQLIAGEFHKDAISRRGKIEDERKQARQDLYRARSLRAAYYFGHAGEPEDRVWLGSQPDPGTDVLALRPDWEYPIACGHKGDDGHDHAG